MRFRWSIICAWALAAIGPASARADYLIDPAGGTVIIDDAITQDDVARTGRSLGFTGRFFGDERTTVDISTNGNLNFEGDTGFVSDPFPLGAARIAVLWDDLIVRQGSGQRVVEKRDPGVSYTVTWEVSQLADPGLVERFQVTWFGSTFHSGALVFQPDDLVFSYQTITTPFDSGDATVGLNRDFDLFVSLPGDADAQIADASASLLPLASQVVLFRPDGFGSYNASIVTIPEPTSLLLLTLGLAIWTLPRSRR